MTDEKRRPRSSEGLFRIFAGFKRPRVATGEIIAVSDSDEDFDVHSKPSNLPTELQMPNDNRGHQLQTTSVVTISHNELEPSPSNTNCQSPVESRDGDAADDHEKLLQASVQSDFFEQFSFNRVGTDSPVAMAFPANVNVMCLPPTPCTSRGSLPSQEKARDVQPEDFGGLSDADQARIRMKWCSFTSGATCKEDARMHMLLAAILHAKATEVAVQSCMAKLRSWSLSCGSSSCNQFANLNAQLLASASNEEIERHIDGIHWHKVKASRIVSAARVVVERFGGHVPVDMPSLLEVPGIGPKLARVLAFVLPFAVAGDDRQTIGDDQDSLETIAE